MSHRPQAGRPRRVTTQPTRRPIPQAPSTQMKPHPVETRKPASRPARRPSAAENRPPAGATRPRSGMQGKKDPSRPVSSEPRNGNAREAERPRRTSTRGLPAAESTRPRSSAPRNAPRVSDHRAPRTTASPDQTQHLRPPPGPARKPNLPGFPPSRAGASNPPPAPTNRGDRPSVETAAPRGPASEVNGPFARSLDPPPSETGDLAGLVSDLGLSQLSRALDGRSPRKAKTLPHSTRKPGPSTNRVLPAHQPQGPAKPLRRASKTTRPPPAPSRRDSRAPPPLTPPPLKTTAKTKRRGETQPPKNRPHIPSSAPLTPEHSRAQTGVKSKAAFWPEVDLEPPTQIASERALRSLSTPAEPRRGANPRPPPIGHKAGRPENRPSDAPAASAWPATTPEAGNIPADANANGPRSEPDPTFTLPTMERRLGSALLDGFLVVGTTVFLTRSGALGEAAAALDVLEPDDIGTKLVQGDLTFALVTFLFLLLCYSTFTHGYLGRSLGKLAFGLRVVTSRTGQQPTPRRALLRAALSVPSLLLGCAGYLWPIVSRRATCLHDLLSFTRVVRRRA